MEVEEAINKCEKFCKYEDNLVLMDTVLYEYQEAIETLLKEYKNSIPTKKIEDKIEELKNYEYWSADREELITELQELLKDK